LACRADGGHRDATAEAGRGAVGPLVTFVRLNLMLQNVGADAHGAGTQAGFGQEDGEGQGDGDHRAHEQQGDRRPDAEPGKSRRERT